MIRLFLIAALAASACASSSLSGSLRSDGYHHKLLPIQVSSLNDQAQSFVAPDWRLDNFKINERGAWEQKTGPGYSTPMTIDLRGDGELPDRSTATDVPAFDVLLKHSRHGAQLWMRTELLPEPYRERTLESLVAAYAEQLSGTAFVGVSVYPVSAGVSRGYAAKVVSAGPTKVGDRDAYEAVIEVANLDQLRLDPQHRSAIMHVVFVESGYNVYQVDDRGRARGRAVIVLGYRATPASYEESHGDFARFRDAVKLGLPAPAGYRIN